MFKVGATEKAKGALGERSKGAGVPIVAAGNHLGDFAGKGILPSPKIPVNTMPRDNPSVRFVAENAGMTRFLPKIKLVTFEGKEPRAWLRKCIKYLEIYGIIGSNG